VRFIYLILQVKKNEERLLGLKYSSKNAMKEYYKIYKLHYK